VGNKVNEVSAADEPQKIVLLVEDDDAAAFLVQLAFRENEPGFKVLRVCDGREALDFLKGRGGHAEAPRPDLMLLNLQMPRSTGFEVLSAVKKDASLRNIPAVVFTSSKLNSDRARCMALGAAAYITKPDTFDDMVAAVKSACAHA
jgi:two-component system response regulator